MKKIIFSILTALLVVCGVALSEFVPDIIVTSPDGVWTDTRAYTTINDAITAIGANVRNVYIVREETTTALTINVNTTLNFMSGGSITNSGQLIINTPDIRASNHQIFTGTGDIDFASGLVLRTAWFSDLEEALDVTSDDNITLVVSKPEIVAANCTVGNNVHLRWESPNIITIDTGFTIDNIGQVEAGDFQLWAGAGDLDFLDGVVLNRNWFYLLRSITDWIETENVTIIIPNDCQVSFDITAPNNILFDLDSRYGSFAIDPGVTLTIFSPSNILSASLHEIKIGAGTLAFTNSGTIPVTWTGAIGDGVTDCTTAVQEAVDIASAIGVGDSIVKYPPGDFLHSGTITVDTTGVYIEGSPGWQTTILRNSDYGDTFFFTGDDVTGTVIREVGLSNVYIKSTALMTSGAHIHANGIIRSSFHHIMMEDGWIGFELDSVTSSYINTIYGVFTNIYGGTAAGRRYMDFGAAAATYSHPTCGDLFISDFNMRGNTSNYNVEYGIYIKSADGIWFDNGYIGHATVANLKLSATDADNFIGGLFFRGIRFEEGYTGNILVSLTGNSTLARNIVFDTCTLKGAAASSYGLATSATAKFYGVTVNNCFISENTSNGILVQSPDCKQFLFSNNQVRGNSYLVAGTGSGYVIGDGDSIQIIGGCSGKLNTTNGVSNQSYGITVGALPTNILISGVDLTLNNTGSLSINAGAKEEVKISNCITDISTTIASASPLILPFYANDDNSFTVTGTTSFISIGTSYSWIGEVVKLKFTGVLTMADATGNLKLSASHTTSADDVLTVMYDGTNWCEVSWSAN